MSEKTADDKEVPVSSVHLIAKADGVAVSSNALEVEDEFADLYISSGNREARVIQPPYDPRRLYQMVYENNALAQCVGAMEVNIDGTGHVVEPEDLDAKVEDDVNVPTFDAFFKEPYPGQSFVTQRRQMRRDTEATGNAYLEVIRNAQDEIVFVRPLDAITMRILKLEDPTPVKKKVNRGGKEIELTVNVRERAFAQKIGTKLIYFRQYGGSRDIDKETGRWNDAGRLPANKRGTEIIHFMVHKDINTPYGLPRWINQVPSVIGSRKAEELNLSFFDSGGIPPAIVFLTGGALSEDSRKMLIGLLSGAAKDKNRGAIVEAHSTSGSLDSAGSVKVQVERFGSEKQNDSMFEKYDDKCEKRTRSSFRLPPLFVGKAEDYSFATAFASYTIAETQVFKPERDEFDEVVNVTLMREIGVEGYVFRSMGLTVQNNELQMKGVELAAKHGAIDKDNLVTSVNELSNLSLRVAAKTDLIPDVTKQQPGAVAGAGLSGGSSTPGTAALVQKIDPVEIVELAHDWAVLAGVSPGVLKEDFSKDVLRERVSQLSPYDRNVFDNLIASKTYSAAYHDFEGSAELAGCASDICNH